MPTDRAAISFSYLGAAIIVGAALLCYPLLRVWDWYGRVTFARRSRGLHRDDLVNQFTFDLTPGARFTVPPMSDAVRQYARRNGLTDAQAAQEWRER